MTLEDAVKALDQAQDNWELHVKIRKENGVIRREYSGEACERRCPLVWTNANGGVYDFNWTLEEIVSVLTSPNRDSAAEICLAKMNRD